jgi:hypothetical protein
MINDAIEISCSGCVDKVLLLSDELVAPSCTEVAEIQVRYIIGLGAVWTDSAPH